MTHSLAAFLLAGGKSSRMGRDKALLAINGETLLERGLRTLRALTPHVAISGGNAALAAHAPLVLDLWPGQGPLGGIVSALQQSQAQWNVFLAVDMPFVPEEAFHAMIAAAVTPCRVVVAESDGRLHPLCGVYSRSALPILARELEAGNLRVRDAIEATDVLLRISFSRREWFANLNTPLDFERARAPRLDIQLT